MEEATTASLFHRIYFPIWCCYGNVYLACSSRKLFDVVAQTIGATPCLM